MCYICSFTGHAALIELKQLCFIMADADIENSEHSVMEIIQTSKSYALTI